MNGRRDLNTSRKNCQPTSLPEYAAPNREVRWQPSTELYCLHLFRRLLPIQREVTLPADLSVDPPWLPQVYTIERLAGKAKESSKFRGANCTKTGAKYSTQRSFRPDCGTRGPTKRSDERSAGRTERSAGTDWRGAVAMSRGWLASMERRAGCRTERLAGENGEVRWQR